MQAISSARRNNDDGGGNESPTSYARALDRKKIIVRGAKRHARDNDGGGEREPASARAGQEKTLSSLSTVHPTLLLLLRSSSPCERTNGRISLARAPKRWRPRGARARERERDERLAAKRFDFFFSAGGSGGDRRRSCCLCFLLFCPATLLAC